jgi:hypothetical protein
MRRAAVLTALWAACGGSPEPIVLDAAAGDYPVARAGFIHLIEGSGFLGTYALIQDGPDPLVPSAIAQDGDCTVFRRPPPALCDPPCTDAVCTAPGVCTTYPGNASAGRITVGGLRAALAFVPGAYGYVTEPASPPADLFDPGAAIAISAPGDVSPAFDVHVTAPPPLDAPFQNLTLVDGTDATVTWTAAGGGPRSIQVMLVVGWHGAPPEALMVCETADDGALTIPGALVAQLPRASSGLEQHGSWILRFDRSIVFAPQGPIEVVAGSQVNLYFSHP